MYPEPVKRFIAGNYTAADEEFVQQWIRKEPKRKKELKQLKDVWEKTGQLRLIEDKDIDEAWQSFESVLEKEAQKSTRDTTQYFDQSRQSRSTSWSTLLKVAAVILLGFGLYSIVDYQQDSIDDKEVQKSVAYQTARASMGERKEIVLEDSTKITLNAGSTIRYSESYGNDNREVHLTGEAYFEVNNKNQSSPFIVNTNKASIKDISTKFNVKAYSEDRSTHVVVSNGRVEVAAIKDSLASDNSTMVSHGKMVNVSNADDALGVENADLSEALAWLDGNLVFKNKPFVEIVRTIERYYAVNITIKDALLNSKKLTASFKNEKLDKVLPVLAISLGAEYKVDGKQISFRKKDQ